MKLYFRFFAIHIKSELAYPGSFLLNCLGRALYFGAVLLGCVFITDRFGAVGGHSLDEILLCFGVILSAHSLAECFARGFDRFSAIVREGQLDRLLVRPRGMVFQVICQDLRLASLGNVLLGLAMLAAAVFGGGIEWTLGRALTLTAMVLCGAVLFFGVFLIYATLCFFTMEGLEVLNIFTDGVKEHGRYPFDVYGKGVLWFLTALLPFALVQYWPLLYLTGEGPAWYGLLPLVSLWFLLPCFALWRFGLRHYRSAGS